jgi:hypothetical protein
MIILSRGEIRNIIEEKAKEYFGDIGDIKSKELQLLIREEMRDNERRVLANQGRDEINNILEILKYGFLEDQLKYIQEKIYEKLNHKNHAEERLKRIREAWSKIQKGEMEGRELRPLMFEAGIPICLKCGKLMKLVTAHEWECECSPNIRVCIG